ncbi:hypothetical protein [Geodermatophilus siccatus]|uniref:hypothetical protein n=1 Tax=Geodermatophilus siccatus TaxID=1137991 RepID=UPI0011133F34|nr:hypothetical protein [Geodermatophilus siccatus]
METADAGRTEALVIGVLVVCALVALGAAVVLGRGIRPADARARAERLFTRADLPAAFQPGVSARR